MKAQAKRTRLQAHIDAMGKSPTQMLPTVTEELQGIQRDVGLIIADVERAKQQSKIADRVKELWSAVRGMDTVLKSLRNVRDPLESVLKTHARIRGGAQ